MQLSSMQEKDIININDGKKMGSIIDIKINEEGFIEEFTIQKRRFIFFGGAVSKISFKEIDKIGKDVILVNSNHG